MLNSLNETVHVPVLLEEVVSMMGDLQGKVIVDGTFGGGGYSRALLDAGAKKVIGID
ncbi:MAG: 16S rRNA (cytosine(1402)-N(4))-methyltransferase, partial [Pseudomonadota bacterium]|nr:16S rRNA (cytosine(1402)-N(4))-methyltransferase [Pseudomonadota bacterium]